MSRLRTASNLPAPSPMFSAIFTFLANIAEKPMTRLCALLPPALALTLCCSPCDAAQSGERSICEWATCDGKADDARAVANAFAAAKNGAFTLVVDCPAFVHIGLDIAKPIFIDNGVTVQFKPGGLFITDNSMVPAFIIADSTNVNLLGWQVEYVGGVPLKSKIDGYARNGVFISQRGAGPSAAANDITITRWLAANRGITFKEAGAVWGAPTDTSAIFYITGATSNVVVKDMKVFVPPSALGSQFVPTVFASIANWKSGETVTKGTTPTPDNAATPSHLVFTNIDLDGYYMGWQGTFADATFAHIRAHRYGDLQDDKGDNVGGAGCSDDIDACWLAPPHLFYINNQHYPGIETKDVTIKDVIDFGNRVGVARNTNSGNLMSLKIGGRNVVVDQYTSYRPDGVADILDCDGMQITNLKGYYDSAYDNNKYPGIRFPGRQYENLVMQNIELTDSNPRVVVNPIGNILVAGNLTLKDIKSIIRGWAGPDEKPPQPVIRTKLNDNTTVEVTYEIDPSAAQPAAAETPANGAE